MKTLAEILSGICNTIIALYFFTIVAMVFQQPHERFFPHHIILTFGVLWLITACVSFANYCEMDEKINSKLKGTK